MIIDQIENTDSNIATVKLLEESSVKHGFSWGKGSKNMSYSFGGTQEVQSNINSFITYAGLEMTEGYVEVVAENEDRILLLEDYLAERELKLEANQSLRISCDAIFTKLSRIPLLIKPADCPVSIVQGICSDGSKIVGLIHTGRRGLDIRLPLKALNYLYYTHGCEPENLIIGITPSILQRNNFMSSLNGLSNRSDWEGFWVYKNGLYYLDVLSNLVKQYLDRGVLEKRVGAYAVDTFEAAGEGYCFSHRYWQVNPTTKNGRFVVAVQKD